MVHSSLMSSEHDSWTTPESLLAPMRADLGQPTLDPCSNEFSTVGAVFSMNEAQDGLAHSWGYYVGPAGYVFMNPPFGREIGKWAAKAVSEARLSVRVVSLTPARTDTAWFHRLAHQADELLLLQGRLKYLKEGKEVGVAPFPSCLMFFNCSSGPELKKLGLSYHV